MKKSRMFLLSVSLCLIVNYAIAQDQGYAAFKQYAFPTELSSAATGGKIAWAMDSAGRRNVYVAEAPNYKPRKLTNYTQDDGQEITSVTISDDGNWLVFVRGGEHSGNWETGLPVNAAFDLQPNKVQVMSIPFNGGKLNTLSEGDYPAISPENNQVAFIKNGQVWLAPIDGTTAAKNLFTTRGNVGSLEWAPNGKQLLFVVGRQDHTVIGIYTDANSPLKWIAPSFSRDQSPRWSPNGKQIVFVRQAGLGGAPDSMLARRHVPWSIYTADVETGLSKQIWKAPTTLRGS
ncbi:MAG: hypothetical protein Q8K64_00185, partial [Sediminibacterium sp.]|nr:hypothetical protein [Sediminibacterium sp.]